MQILYEDNHIIIVNKKVADIVQGDKTGDLPLSEKVKDYLKKKYNKKGDAFLGVVHRLDRPVSGAVIFAKTSKALSRLNKMFSNKEVKKIYWAVVKDAPPEEEGKLEHYMIRNREKNKSFAYDKPKENSKYAVLNYKLLTKSNKYFLLEIDLETGRHHQIRAQLAKIGCPIRGDLKYGFSRSNKDGGILLHARYIDFIHPVSKKHIKIEADVPDQNLWKYFEKEMNRRI